MLDFFVKQYVALNSDAHQMFNVLRYRYRPLRFLPIHRDYIFKLQ